MNQSIRGGYESFGVEGFYEQLGDSYRNPHEPQIRELLAQAHRIRPIVFEKVLDLACGSGEVTLALRELGCTDIIGADPYTATAYMNRTGGQARRLTFEGIAGGILYRDASFNTIVCSFALHLAEESRLASVCMNLALVGHELIILTPHKRPDIPEDYGWAFQDELIHERVRCRRYKSLWYVPYEKRT